MNEQCRGTISWFYKIFLKYVKSKLLHVKSSPRCIGLNLGYQRLFKEKYFLYFLVIILKKCIYFHIMIFVLENKFLSCSNYKTLMLLSINILENFLHNLNKWKIASQRCITITLMRKNLGFKYIFKHTFSQG